MLKIYRTNSENTDFRNLVQALDAELEERDGKDDHVFYAQFNKIDAIRHVLIGYMDSEPVSCGAIKEYAPDTVEIKRMYVRPSKRSMGIASEILHELEQWAKELGYQKCILETGKKQPEAIRLYQKNEYQITPNFGQYLGDENSVCFEKRI
jgi:GNAT superfamily N-acetyltransferase